MRPRNGLDVTLGRAAVGEGGFVAGEIRRGRSQVGARLGTGGGDIAIRLGPLAFAGSTGGLWQVGTLRDLSGLDLIRSVGGAWFLRTRHGLRITHGSLRLEAAERLEGAVASSRGDARSLRFDRRAGWSGMFRTVAARVDLKWRKNLADGGTVRTVPAVIAAANETREAVAAVSGRGVAHPWSADLRIRRSASRSVGGLPSRVTSVFLRHRGSWSADRTPDSRVGWELGLRGSYRVGSERTQSWISLYRERRTWLGRWTWGLCEVHGAPGSRPTLDLAWSKLRPRSVPADSRWAVVSCEGGMGALRWEGGGAVPLSVPNEAAAWEARLRLEFALPLSPGPDPG